MVQTNPIVHVHFLHQLLCIRVSTIIIPIDWMQVIWKYCVWYRIILKPLFEGNKQDSVLDDHMWTILPRSVSSLSNSMNSGNFSIWRSIIDYEKVLENNENMRELLQQRAPWIKRTCDWTITMLKCYSSRAPAQWSIHGMFRGNHTINQSNGNKSFDEEMTEQEFRNFHRDSRIFGVSIVLRRSISFSEKLSRF